MGDSGRYLGLDGLRGVAAIVVVLLHAQLFALHGYLAVDLFFIMSGFVIAGSYEGRLASGQLGFRDYAVQRLWRLYPMLFLGGLVGLGFVLAGQAAYRIDTHSDLALAIVSQFLLIPFLSASSMVFPLNNPQWSIVWELAANFAHAAGLKRARNATLGCIVALSVCALGWYAAEMHTLSVGITWNGALGGMARAGFGFFAGVLLHRTRVHWESRIPRMHFAVPALLFTLLVSVPPSIVPNGLLFGLYDLMIAVVALVPLVMLAARAHGGVVAQALGHASYPLYAINEPFIVWLAHHTDAARGTLVLAIAGLIVAAWILGRWVDVPLNAWRRRARNRHSAARTEQLAPLTV